MKPGRRDGPAGGRVVKWVREAWEKNMEMRLRLWVVDQISKLIARALPGNFARFSHYYSKNLLANTLAQITI